MSFTQMFTNSGSPPMRDPKFKIRGEPLDARTVQYAHSIEDIDTLTHLFKRYDIKGRYTLGDILGQVIFHPRPTEATELAPSETKDGTSPSTSSIPSSPREIPAWSHAMPVIGKKTTAGDVKAFPIFDMSYTPDDRFEPIGGGEMSLPDDAVLADGQVGIMIGGTKEDGSIENLFLPIGGASPLVAVNNAFADPLLSSPVYDIEEGTSTSISKELSEEDKAPLHTAWRVMRPRFKFVVSPKLPVDPILAWQLADPTYSLAAYGSCVDYDFSLVRGEKKPILGFGGAKLGGPFFVGESHKEKHLVGETEDGEPEMSLHLDTLTLFKRKGGFGSDFDAPLKFEGLYHRDDPLPYVKRAHIRYDPCEKHPWITTTREGFWKVQIESEIAGSHDVIDPDGGTGGGSGGDFTGEGGSGSNTTVADFLDLPPSEGEGGGVIGDGVDEKKEDPPDCYDLLEERRKEMEGSSSSSSSSSASSVSGFGSGTSDPVKLASQTVPLFDKFSRNRSDFADTESYRLTPFRMAFPEILGKPHSTIINSPDLRDYTLSTLTSVLPLLDKYNKYMPVTSRLIFYGGVQGDQFSPEYTQSAQDITGRFLSGTGNGGLVLTPPEIDSADLRYQNTNGGHIPEIENSEVSETTFTLVPGVRLVYGYPDLELGTRKYGWSSTFNHSTNELDYALKVSSGTETTLLNFPSTATVTDAFRFASDIQTGNNLILKGGTSFKTTITSTPTANRTGTIQNSSGTFAWLTDIPAGAGVWSRTGTNIYPTTAGDTVGFTQSSTVPTLRGVTDTTSGVSIDTNKVLFWGGGNLAATMDSLKNLNVVNQIKWDDNTAFTATLTHNISAARSYTFQDFDYTVDSLRKKIATKTADYTITVNDGTIIVDATSGDIEITLPAATDVHDNGLGQVFNIKRVDSSVHGVRVVTTGGESIDGSTSYSIKKAYISITVQSDGTQYWII